MPWEKWGSLVTSESMGSRRAPRGALVLMSAVSLVALSLGVTSASAVEPKVVVQSRTNSTTSLDVSWTEVKGAAGYRIAGQRVDDRAELRPALEKMLAHPGSFLLEVMVTKENNIFPMVPQGCSVAEIRLK